MRSGKAGQAGAVLAAATLSLASTPLCDGGASPDSQAATPEHARLMVEDLAARLDWPFVTELDQPAKVEKLLRDCGFSPTDLDGDGSPEVAVEVHWFEPDPSGASGRRDRLRGAQGQGDFFLYATIAGRPVLLGALHGDRWQALATTTGGYRDVETHHHLGATEGLLTTYRYLEGRYVVSARVRLADAPDGAAEGKPVPVVATAEEARAWVTAKAPGALAHYRFPDHGDLQGDWKEQAERHGHPPIFAWGDFNGDGARDLAFLLPRRRPAPPERRQPADRQTGRGTGFGLFCLLSASSGEHRLHTLEQDEGSLLWRHGVATVPPGRYSTFCGQAHGPPSPDCAGQPKEVVLRHDAIALFAFEVSEVYYIWDRVRGSFRKVSITD